MTVKFCGELVVMDLDSGNTFNLGDVTDVEIQRTETIPKQGYEKLSSKTAEIIHTFGGVIEASVNVNTTLLKYIAGIAPNNYLKRKHKPMRKRLRKKFIEY